MFITAAALLLLGASRSSAGGRFICCDSEVEFDLLNLCRDIRGGFPVVRLVTM